MLKNARSIADWQKETATQAFWRPLHIVYGNRHPLPNQTQYCFRRPGTISQCVGRKSPVRRTSSSTGARSSFCNGGGKIAGDRACSDERRLARGFGDQRRRLRRKIQL